MAKMPLGTELPTVPRDTLRDAGPGPAGRRSGLQEILAAQRATLESAARHLKLIRSGIKLTTRQSVPTSEDTTGGGATHRQTGAPLPPASVHVRRLLRNQIAADPDAFFEQADEDESDDLTWDEWVKTCQVFAGEDVDPAVLKQLFAEVAGDDAVTIARGRLTEFAQLHRAVRHFVDKAGCTDVLVDGLITSLLCEQQSAAASRLPVRQGVKGRGQPAALQELLATVCEEYAPVHDVAAALREQAAIEKAQLASRADAPPPEACDEDDAKESKYTNNLPVSWLCAACAPLSH